MTVPRWIVGVDVGGTFTDAVFLDSASGRVEIAKVPSTRPDQADGFVTALRAHAPDLAAIAAIVHGTTVGTNALLERKGGRIGVITTRGFRDVLEMRRRDRPQTWGLWGQFAPLVPRDLRLEVDERTLADGSVRIPVNLAQVRAAGERLLAQGVEAVAVFFINAYANASNERATRETLLEIWPNANVVASSDILPEIREYERASTTAINAYLQPPVGAYLARLEQRLGQGGFAGDVLIMQSNGGAMRLDTARRLPVRTARSGPAAGVIAAAAVAQAAGFDNVVACDMGGTSFDVSLMAGGQPSRAAQASIGFGMVVRTPMIEITTIGAGGGSLAWIDRGGLLQVGPESAGSDPGPVCYGRGGTQPTVTDANLVLGRIDAAQPIGGISALDVHAARAAIEAEIGKPLGLDAMTAAEAIIRVANAAMAGAIRLVSIERGHDPQNFVLLPFGGGGALHAGALLREVGLSRALVPRFPGVASALGCVIADLRHDFVRTVNAGLAEVDIAALTRDLTERAIEGEALLARSGVADDAIELQVELDMLYQGQTHTVSVPYPAEPDGVTLFSRQGLQAAFDTAYRGTYGRLLDGVPVRILNLRAAVIGRRPKLDLAMLAPRAGGTLEAARRGSRRIWLDATWREAAVYDRLALPPYARVVGPAILVQPDTTIFVEPGHAAVVDRLGNLLLGPEDA